jgi:hypothetical protein
LKCDVFYIPLSMDTPEELPSYLRARIPKPKKEKRPLRTISPKKLVQQAAEKKLVSSEGDTLKELWFKARRSEMTGVCQCGCAEPSQKKDNIYFRHSIAHIFPKHLFPSIMYHPLNWVERRFWAGSAGATACHSLMDDTSMERWANFADWDDIKMKFYVLAPLLTPEERATNFYTRLEKLVHEK